MKAILTKDKCLAAIGERADEVTNDSKRDEMDGNAIANLHLALANGVLSSIEEKKTANDICDHLALFDDVAAAILEEENRRNNMEDMQTNSRQMEALVVTRGMSMESGFSGSHNQEISLALQNMVMLCVVKQQLQMKAGNFLGGFVYSCNDHELKIIGIRSIVVKMHDGGNTKHDYENYKRRACTYERRKVSANLYQLKGEIIEEAEASVASHSLIHRVAVTWHQKLKHMSKQGMKILVERKLLPGLTKIKCLRTNNGGEYTNDEFDSFRRHKEIKRQFTTAYTPQKNGVAERMNRTLLERARAMLATTSLRKSFWVEAVISACYVINHCPSTTVEMKTPMKMWTGKPHEVNEINESQDPATRTINFKRRHPRWHSDYVMDSNIAYCLLTKEREPSTLQEALNNPDASFWKVEMQEEIKTLHKNKTWELMSLPRGRKPIRNKWVYKIKKNSDHQVESYRTRLVVKGYAQKRESNLMKYFPPVVRMTTIRVVMAMYVIYDLHLEQLDMKTTFLHGSLEEEIYMLQPEGFEQKGKETLVNDMLVAGLNKDHINKLKAQLAREFEIKDFGLTNKILGMQIHRDRLSSKMSPRSEKERIEMSRVPYALAVGSLMFVMICTRPDIAYAVGVVSRYMEKPSREHWEAVKRIFRCIKGTSDVALCFGESDLIVKGYVDSDYAVVAMSKTEAEYVAAAQGEGGDKEFVVMGESREDLLEEDMIVMRRSKEFRKEEVVMCEDDE
uniref:Integrase catalytic domain-containing protein n=1 Tax=Tanacetum cinerariifolium TaxID=118510 RepID=A0A6L2KI19_TANCI|nr:hypothetical protein [Tanacetum cinerariifolium]